MKAICKQVTSIGFDLNEVTTVFSNNFDYSFGGYGLELNREYVVMGVVQYRDSSCIYYLVDTFGKPDWFPSLLFDISDNVINKGWRMRVFDKSINTEINFIISFEEFCELSFYDRLSKRNKSALDVYFLKKSQLMGG